jgi:hypothetical protein
MTRTSLEEASAAPPAVPASADPSVRPSTACGSAAAASRHKQRPIAVLPRASEQRDEARERRSAGRPCACPSGSAVMSGRSRARRGENVGPRHAITAEGKWTPRNCTRAAQGPRWWEDIRRRARAPAGGARAGEWHGMPVYPTSCSSPRQSYLSNTFSVSQYWHF